MALLAEELVEEWLNRQGYFTIRGIKVGVDEIDLLAVKFTENGGVDCRHIEVQASMRPVSYISKIPKEHLKANQSPSSAKARTTEILEAGVKEWVNKKFIKPNKSKVISSLFPTKWSFELVVNNVKSEQELSLIEEEDIKIIKLPHIIEQLNNNSFNIQSASGSDFVDLIRLASKNT